MDLIQSLGEILVSLKDGVLYYVPGVGRPDRVLEFLGGHLLITFVTLFFAVLISVPLGILITRVRGLYSPIIKLTGMLYTVPSLAQFGATESGRLWAVQSRWPAKAKTSVM